jgi:hypothetical protein
VNIQRFDAFISHSSKDRRTAALVEAALGSRRAWLDRSDIRLGSLLGRELLAQIRKSRTLVLVWSKHASRSPWVQSEWISAVNLGKPVIPLVVDTTTLPQCLANTLWQSARGLRKAAIDELARTVRGRLPRGGSVSPAMRVADVGLDAAVDRLGRAQESVFTARDSGGIAAARRRQQRLEREVGALVEKHPLDSRAAVLWAYNAKNGVILDYEAEIAAGIRVVDKRLDQARWRFLHALWLDPFNPEALNGLGTIAWFGHDLDSAEFFVRAALRRLPGYPAARQDLDSALTPRMVLALRTTRAERQDGMGELPRVRPKSRKAWREWLTKNLRITSRHSPHTHYPFLLQLRGGIDCCLPGRTT